MENIEQYKKRFFNLMESTMGDVKPLINEQELTFDKNYFVSKKTGSITLGQYGSIQEIDGNKITDDYSLSELFSIKNIGGRGFVPGTYTWTYSDTTSTGIMGPGQEKPGFTVTDSSGNEIGTLIFK
jgi:hypothetical protein